MLALRRMNRANFDALLAQWRPFFGDDEDLLYEHCRPHLEHAERIVDETPQDSRYGIYALVRNTADEEIYEGFTHINHKLAGSPHAEVRMVWNTLSPRYETELEAGALADFTFAYISGAIALAQAEMRADAVRLYLGNATDKQYAQGIVTHMRRHHDGGPVVALAGNWLHITGVTGLSL